MLWLNILCKCCGVICDILIFTNMATLTNDDKTLIKNIKIKKGWSALTMMREFPPWKWEWSTLCYLIKRNNDTGKFDRRKSAADHDLQERQQTFIQLENWPPNSPDLNPVDYCVWGHCDRWCNWIEGLPERTEHLYIFLFSAHHSVVFCFWCSVYCWRGVSDFNVLKYCSQLSKTYYNVLFGSSTPDRYVRRIYLQTFAADENHS